MPTDLRAFSLYLLLQLYLPLHTITPLLVSSDLSSSCVNLIFSSSNFDVAAFFHSPEFRPPLAANALLANPCATGPRMA